MNIYTLAEFERANNYWRERQASGEDAARCPRARVLADVYGAMIYNTVNEVDARVLSADQNDALNLALAQRDLLI